MKITKQTKVIGILEKHYGSLEVAKNIAEIIKESVRDYGQSEAERMCVVDGGFSWQAARYLVNSLKES